MNLNPYGSTISWPLRVDQSGSFVTTSDPDEIIEQGIADILETSRGERVSMPDYGIDDYVFSVQDSTFAVRLADHLETQIGRYMPLVDKVKCKAATDDRGRATVEVQYLAVGQFNAPKNLVFPVWRLAAGLSLRGAE